MITALKLKRKAVLPVHAVLEDVVRALHVSSLDVRLQLLAAPRRRQEASHAWRGAELRRKGKDG